jgi:D-alanine-D-alanine ligase
MRYKIAIIFGGKSTEHEVSLNSATNIFNAVDKSVFDVTLLGVDKAGRWRYNANYPRDNIDLKEVDYFNQSTEVIVEKAEERALIIDKESRETVDSFDIAFPIIHGNFGEDGTLQGYLKALQIPFVGPDLLASAICMDKEITKRVLRDHGIPVSRFISLNKEGQSRPSFQQVKELLGLPLFVKPCNGGSSVGVSKVFDAVSLEKAIKLAFTYDDNLLIEEAIIGKELECAVLGNEKPEASIIGELVPTREFYSYDAKYNDAQGATITIPADIPDEISSRLRDTAVKAYKATRCEGMARIDFFLKDDNTFVLNEINTLPGFTEISMYPKLWEHSGMSYTELITRLVELAIERKKNKSIKTER